MQFRRVSVNLVAFRKGFSLRSGPKCSCSHILFIAIFDCLDDFDGVEDVENPVDDNDDEGEEACF
jgi:hypothetical protein